MDIVIDTSAIIAVMLNEPEKKKIIQITAGNTLVGPESIRWEIGNAFSAMFKQRRISLRLAQKRWIFLGSFLYDIWMWISIIH